MAFLKLLGWRGIAGIVTALVLGTLLIIQRGETHHWRSQATTNLQLYQQEKLAFEQTVLNYRKAAEQAQATDKANADRVAHEQAVITQEREKSYEERIADARARADSLRRQLEAAANPSGSHKPPVPGLSGPASGPNGPATEAGLPPGDALIATEQAIQLDELEHWVKDQVSVDPNAPPGR